VIAVWVLLAAVALVSCYFLLQVVKKLSRTMGALVKSMEELGEVATDLTRLRNEMRDENGSVDDASRQ
jgi:uncharacterized protein YoxC